MLSLIPSLGRAVAECTLPYESPTSGDALRSLQVCVRACARV